MNKCRKEDCIDFDTPLEEVEFGLDSCEECRENRQNPTWVQAKTNYQPGGQDIVDPTEDVPVGSNFNSPMDQTFTPIPIMKDRRDSANAFIEEEAAEISEESFKALANGNDMNAGWNGNDMHAGWIQKKVEPLADGLSAPAGMELERVPTPEYPEFPKYPNSEAVREAADEEYEADVSPVFTNIPKEIKDSGERTVFSTGANRDAQGGKGRFDLLPKMAIWALAHHYEKGCIKYGARNWEKGIPIQNFLDSGARHATEFELGLTDENHLIACIWNYLSAYETLLRIDMGILPKSLDTLPYPLRGVIQDSEMVMPWDRMRYRKLDARDAQDV